MSIDTADWWFAALDGKPIVVGAERWIAHVVGVHVDGPHLWIQLAAAGDPSRSAVLHIRSGSSETETLDTTPEFRYIDCRIHGEDESALDPLQFARH